MSLNTFPVELLLEIPIHLGSFQDLAALVKTCRLFHDVFNPLLYKYDVKTGSPIAMFWAARWGRLRTLQLSHAAGANLKQAWTQRVPLMQATSGNKLTARTYKEMGRHSAATYVRLFHDTHSEESDSESFSDTDIDDSSISEGEESSDSSDVDSDDLPQRILNEWKEGSEETKTASENNSYTFSNFILKPNFDLYIRFDRPFPLYWWHPLDLAVQFGHTAIIEYLLDNGVKVQESHSRGLCPFYTCPGTLRVGGGMREIPGLPYADSNSAHHPLLLAACRGDLEMQKFLLRKVGLDQMAKRLTWKKVDTHHYMYGWLDEKHFHSEADMFLDFAIWNAGEPEVSDQTLRWNSW